MSEVFTAPVGALVSGVRIHSLSLGETVNAIRDACRVPEAGLFVVTPNAQHIVLFQENDLFRAAYEAAWLRVTDGVPLLWASRLLGFRLPGRVNGTDLMEAVCAMAAREGVRIFLFGARPGSAEKAAAVLRAQHPAIRIVGTFAPPYGFLDDPSECRCAIAAVRSAHPQLVLVALSAPAQELWMARYSRATGASVLIGVGASFDFIAGAVRRAPRAVQRAGLEWFFRLCLEPRRLLRRYLVCNLKFIRSVLKQKFAASATLR